VARPTIALIGPTPRSPGPAFELGVGTGVEAFERQVQCTGEGTGAAGLVPAGDALCDMSPRAAWRPERLRFGPVYDDAAGKVDGMAAGLPTVRARRGSHR
jgi:hypothetical protein